MLLQCALPWSAGAQSVHKECRVNSLGPRSARTLKHCSHVEIWYNVSRHAVDNRHRSRSDHRGAPRWHGVRQISSHEPIADTAYLRPREAPAPAGTVLTLSVSAS